MTNVDTGARPSGGFRPTSRRRARIAGGAALAAAAIGGNVLVYTSLDDRAQVIQVVADIRAGEAVEPGDLRVVEADLDPTVPVTSGDDLPLVVGQFARVHIASGSLMSPVLVQPEPLVADGRSVVAIEIRPTLVPDGIRERSAVDLVVARDDADAVTVAGRVVTRPAPAEDVTGVFTMSVEVDAGQAELVASGDDIRVVLRDPANDPLFTTGADG